MTSGADLAMAQNGIRIGQLAQMLGTTTKTLRFYEGIGLLDPPGRTASAYRLYDNAAVERARLVIDLRQLGLSLREVQDVLRDDLETSQRQRLLALMDEKLREMYLQLCILQGRSDDFAARHAALLATPRGRRPDCLCAALLRPCSCR